jgi:hypothetical protein
MPVALPLAEVCTLVVGLLIIFAVTLLFRGLLQSMVSRIPLLGHALSAVIGLVLADTESWIMTPVHWIAGLFERVGLQLYNLATALVHLAQSVIPQLRLELINLINQEVTGAENYALTLDQQLYNDLTGSLAQVYAYISTEVQGVDNYVISEIRGVDGYIQSEISTLTAWVTAQDAQLLTYVQQGLAADQAYADALYHDAITYAQSAVVALDGTITADLTGLQDWVTTQLTSLQTYITGLLALAYAYTDTRVATVEADLQALKTDCTDNLCANLTPLANLLSDLGSLWDIAAIIAFAAAMATDPAGAAGQLRSAVGDVVDGTVSVIRDAVGV